MLFKEIIGLLKKKGFKDTFQILINQDNYKADRHTFYKELNKFSYYNSFLRVKEELVKKGIIEIGYNNSRVKYIKLTEKGVALYNKLSEINDLISN